MTEKIGIDTNIVRHALASANAMNCSVSFNCIMPGVPGDRQNKLVERLAWFAVFYSALGNTDTAAVSNAMKTALAMEGIDCE